MVNESGMTISAAGFTAHALQRPLDLNGIGNRSRDCSPVGAAASARPNIP